MRLGILILLAAGGAGAATPLEQAYRAMYNLDFATARAVLGQYEAAHPEDPMAPVSEAAAHLFGEFDRLRVLQSEFFTDDNTFFSRQKTLTPDVGAQKLFNAALVRTDQAAAAALRRNADDENALLAQLLRIGLHADYVAFIEKKNLAALAEVKQSRTLAESLIERHPQNYDAYLAIGVENYMLSLKPAAVRWFLRMNGAETDRRTGVERLRITAAKGHYLLPYARLLLAVAALRERDYAGARATLGWLSSEFPANRLYREELAKIR